MSHSRENPGHGSTSEVDSFKTHQINRVTACSDVSTGLTTILNSGAATSWQSASATAWRERMARVFPMLDGASHVVRPWRDAAANYHTTLDDITSRANTSFHDISTGYTMLNAFSHVPYEVTSTPEFQAKMQRYQDDINDGYVNLNYLTELRQAADSLFAGWLNEHGVLGENRDWVALQTFYGDAKSVGDILDVRAAAINEANKLANAVEGTNPDLEDIDELTRLLSVMASDPTLAGDFWKGRGGEDPLELMQAGLQQHMSYPDGLGFLSDEDEAAALAFARSIRDSLASGSQTWDDPTAKNFAAQMITGGDWPGDTRFNAGQYQGIGFLFDDPENNPMGEKFTVATADLIDAWERAEGEQGIPRGTSLSDPNASQAWYERISMEDEIDRGVYEDGFQPSRDPMGRVLDNLGLYPDAAWEWLTADGTTLANGEPAIAEDKLNYYASRDWSADGWDGFGSLWEGSMGATDGLTSGNYNEAKWMEMGDVANRVMEGLVSAQPETFHGSALSQAGGDSLGRAAANLMVWTAESIDTGGGGSDTDLTTTLGTTTFYLSEYPGLGMIQTPELSTSLIASFWGSVAANDSGLAAIQAGIDKTTGLYFAQADSLGTPLAWEHALETYTNLQGAVTGSVGGAEILYERYHDELMRERIALASEALGLIPIPGLDEAPKMVGIAVDQAIGAGWDMLGDGLAGGEDKAVTDALAKDDAIKTEVERYIRDLANDRTLGFGDVFPPDSEALNDLVRDARGDAYSVAGSSSFFAEHYAN